MVLLKMFKTSRMLRMVHTRSHYTPQEYNVVVSKDEVKKFCIGCMTKVGVNKTHASSLADVLVAGDYRGHYSHGLNRLEMYVLDIQKGVCDIKNEPSITKETESIAHVNGNNILGPVVGNFCMQLAIKKAKKTGISWVSANGSNHYGIAGYYSLLASKEGLIGISFTNTSPLVYPTRACKLAVGTNPIAVSAPSTKVTNDYVLDMATSAVAVGKIEMYRRRGLPIPYGWAADSSGKASTDPNVVITEGGLLPLGGEEETGGYKGYGLGMLVEIFCGVLSNAEYGTNIRRWLTRDTAANLGHAFAAIDPDAFTVGFKERLTDYVDMMRNLPRTNSDKPIVIPGDYEREHQKECEELGGIPYPSVLLDSLDKLAKKLNVDTIKKLKTI